MFLADALASHVQLPWILYVGIMIGGRRASLRSSARSLGKKNDTMSETLKNILSSMPGAQIAALGLFMTIAVVGGNYVFIRHNRRRGRPALRGWTVFGSLRDFDHTDWLWLAAVYAASFACLGLAFLVD